MLRLAADENLDRRLVRGFLRRLPEADFVIVQQAGLAGTSDPELLTWCADHRRVLVSHDVNTIIEHAKQRVRAGESMPGALLIRQTAPMRQVIEDLVLVTSASEPGDYEGQILHLPL